MRKFLGGEIRRRRPDNERLIILTFQMVFAILKWRYCSKFKEDVTYFI